jgi:hypothetical protein
MLHELYSGRAALVSLTGPALRMLIFFIWNLSFRLVGQGTAS